MAHSLRGLNNTASYSAMLLVHLFISFVNFRRAAYFNLMLEGETRTAAAPAKL
jgi:hypothetical protein